jgi:hypothetical protein
MEIEINQLRKANETLSKRKTRKRKVLKGFVSRSIADGLQSISQHQNRTQTQQTDGSGGNSISRVRRCGRCREPGHRIETCPQPQLATLDNVDPSLLSN